MGAWTELAILDGPASTGAVGLGDQDADGLGDWGAAKPGGSAELDLCWGALARGTNDRSDVCTATLPAESIGATALGSAPGAWIGRPTAAFGDDVLGAAWWVPVSETY